MATGRKWESPENGSNKPIGNRSQPTATVSERMVKVDHLLAKEGVAFLAPQRENESRESEGQNSVRKLTDCIPLLQLNDCELAVGQEGERPQLSAKRAVDGDLVQGVLEKGEFLVVEFCDE